MNIGGSPDDPFYRYKMPAVITSYQRKSGGSSIVDNTAAICTSINRDAKHISKYLSKALGRPVVIKNGCWTLHGIVEAQVIQKHINEYISAHVLCKVCGNPETVVESNKLSCKSCGHEIKLA